MKRPLLAVLAFTLGCGPKTSANPELAASEQRAQGITITRDDWGIPHITAKTDADAVFGLIYAQAEDDFNRVETNYLYSLGRLAEAEGESAIYRDLRQKLFIDPADLKAKFETSPDWLKKLMTAWADGLNFYLAKHPETKPRVITKFEPWMALSFSEGSIGGDIERISLKDLEAFYGDPSTQMSAAPRGAAELASTDLGVPAEPQGSNGFAIAPANNKNHRAMLLINPHTSFFFRAEVQVTSEEGLNAYGAVTWGQFFVYQGFNDRLGWMHTSSGVDAIDEYLETVSKKGDGLSYRFGTEDRAVTATTLKIPYKSAGGAAEKVFTVYRTQHGPVIRNQNGKWVAIRLMQEPVKALTQSWSRTKAKSYQAFHDVMDLHTNSSNNTIFASADGDIAYFHANFVPKRNPKFDWTKPVDGSDPATEWQGIHAVDESPNVKNPSVGWIQNTNNWPFSVSGPDSPKQKDFPAYFEQGTENPRGVHAMRVLGHKKDFDLDGLIAAAYDPYLTAFADLVPHLIKSYDGTPASNPLKAKLAEQVDSLRKWDFHWGVASVPTALAVYWGDELWRRVSAEEDMEGLSIYQYMATRTEPQTVLEALAAASDKLQADFGTWRTPWGDINRFQRLTDDIVHPFDDKGPSIPVGFTSSRWGSLASFGARSYNDSKKLYGTNGNSFVAAVEFGADSVRARAVTAGGLSGDPKSKHFNDQAERYATGNLRPVYFYPNQLQGHTERVYHPGS